MAEVYNTVLRSDAAAGFVAVDDQSRVLGVVTGVCDIRAFRKSLIALRTIARGAGRFVSRPRAWAALFQSLMQRGPAKPTSTTAILTSIAVDEDARKLGAGRMLVRPLEDWFASRGVQVYCLETRKENVVAQSFYLKMGFQEYSRGSHDLCLVKQIPRT